MADNSRHPSLQPMQPVELDEQGIARFRSNDLVRSLLEAAFARSRRGLWELLADARFSAADREQLAQLVGITVDGFIELECACDDSITAAVAAMDAAERAADHSPTPAALTSSATTTIDPEAGDATRLDDTR